MEHRVLEMATAMDARQAAMVLLARDKVASHLIPMVLLDWATATVMVMDVLQAATALLVRVRVVSVANPLIHTALLAQAMPMVTDGPQAAMVLLVKAKADSVANPRTRTVLQVLAMAMVVVVHRAATAHQARVKDRAVSVADHPTHMVRRHQELAQPALVVPVVQVVTTTTM